MKFTLDKHQRIPKGQSQLDNAEKLATSGTQDDEKQNENTTQTQTAISRRQTVFNSDGQQSTEIKKTNYHLSPSH